MTPTRDPLPPFRDAAPVPFDLAAKIAEGFHFTKAGDEWTVITPDGQTGHGESPEAAVLNVGSVIIPNADGRRERHRADGSVIAIDQPIPVDGE